MLAELLGAPKSGQDEGTKLRPLMENDLCGGGHAADKIITVHKFVATASTILPSIYHGPGLPPFKFARFAETRHFVFGYDGGILDFPRTFMRPHQVGYIFSDFSSQPLSHLPNRLRFVLHGASPAYGC
ncbi:hypothetical protein V1517DRAFT_342270 [Lipomyces orientalis]|uniref:Uncharacterized protein n=1 Tax=Lipomyces orientalis TaxID=1233043 RepID=A0ACC3TCF4_9ASCO